MASGNTDTLEALEFALVQLQDECTSQQYTDCISTLLKIFRNIQKNPSEAKYKELKTNNKTFSDKVWGFPAAQQLLIASGWSEIEERIILLDDQYVTSIVEILEQIASSQADVNRPTAPSSVSASNGFKSEKNVQLDDIRKKQMEQMKREKEERNRIAEQIKADRRETKNRPTKDSVARPRQFGANINRFEDIGVDLNKGGG